MADGSQSPETHAGGPTVLLGAHAPGAMVTVAAAGLVVALAGAMRQTRYLESVERHRTLEPAARAAWWVPTPGARPELPLGTLQVPAGGQVRVSVCPTANLHAPMTLMVSPPGRPRSWVRFVPDDDVGGRCLTASWRGAGTASVDLRVAAVAPPPVLREVDLRAGGRITPRTAWPMAMMLLALGALVFAPRRQGPWPPSPPEAAGLDPLRAAVVASPWTVMVTLLGVSFMLPVLVFLAGGSAHALLFGLVLQPALMAGAAGVFLGAFESVDGRGALGLGPIGHRALGETLVTAAGLLGVAMGTSYLLKNPGDSPIGQALASMPVRYAVAFGALGAPMGEELYFRGVLVSVLGRRRLTVGIWASAAVFTGMHVMQLSGAWLGLLPIAALGVANGYLRVRTRGMTAPWLVHTIYNTVLASSVLLAP